MTEQREDLGVESVLIGRVGGEIVEEVGEDDADRVALGTVRYQFQTEEALDGKLKGKAYVAATRMNAESR